MEALSEDFTFLNNQSSHHPLVIGRLGIFVDIQLPFDITIFVNQLSEEGNLFGVLV